MQPQNLAYSSSGQDSRFSFLQQGFDSPIGYKIFMNKSLSNIIERDFYFKNEAICHCIQLKLTDGYYFTKNILKNQSAILLKRKKYYLCIALAGNNYS